MLFKMLAATISLNTKEQFKNVEDIPETPETIKAYIPKLMPKVELGNEAKTDIHHPINRNAFANASDCSVKCSTMVKGQNFITLRPRDNEYPNFRSKAVFENGVYIVKKHADFILEVMHEDINDLRFTGDV